MFTLEGEGRLINPCTNNAGEKKDWDRIFLEYPEACSKIIKIFEMNKKIYDLTKGDKLSPEKKAALEFDVVLDTLDTRYKKLTKDNK